MKRYGSIIEVKEDKLDEYIRLHTEVWSEVVEVDMVKMASDPNTQRWWDICKPCQNPLPDLAEKDWWALMKEVFHVD